LRASDFESASILKATANASRRLAELKGLAAVIPNLASDNYLKRSTTTIVSG
jgi:hypothetical protein